MPHGKGRVQYVELPVRGALHTFVLNHAAAGSSPWTVTAGLAHHDNRAEYTGVRGRGGGLGFNPDPGYQALARRLDEFIGADTGTRYGEPPNGTLTGELTADLLRSWMVARAFKQYVFDREDVRVARFVYPRSWREILTDEARELYLNTARERLDASGVKVPDSEPRVWLAPREEAYDQRYRYFVHLAGREFEVEVVGALVDVSEAGPPQRARRDWGRNIWSQPGQHMGSATLRQWINERRLAWEIESGMGG